MIWSGSAASGNDWLPGMTDFRRTAWPAAALALLIAALFAQTAGHDFITFDDDEYLYNNSHVLAGLGSESIRWAFTSFFHTWHPLTWLSHLLDVSLFGLNPAGHHLHSVLLHYGSTLLLFLFLRSATGASGKSLLVAAIFAIHPLRAESVVWVAQRKDVLATFFAMAALRAYIGYALTGSRRLFTASLLLFALSLMSKATMVMLPFILLLVDFWPLKRYFANGGAVRLVKEKIPFCLLSAVSGVLTIVAQFRNSSFSSLEQMPPVTRIGHAVVSFWRYLDNLLFPRDLSFYYPFNLNQSMIPVAAGMVAFVLATAAVISMRRRLSELLVGWLWFVLAMAPVIGIIPMADRYTYFSSVGLLIAFVWLGGKGLERLRMPRVAVAAVALALCAAYGVGGFRQVARWKDSATLYRYALAVNPDNYMALNQMGYLYMSSGNCRDAVPYFNNSLLRLSAQPRALNNLGLCLWQDGNPAAAVPLLEEAIRLDHAPAGTYYNLGLVLQELGRRSEAEEAFANYRRLGGSGADSRLIDLQPPAPGRISP